MKPIITRRTALSILSASPLLVSTMPLAASSADAHLIALGREFNAVVAKLDQAISSGIDFDDSVLDQLGRLDAEIVATQALTMEGLGVKARAACWALLDDLDDASDATTDRRMALSIIRDLIRLHAPDLEEPGALKKLVEEIEKEATRSIHVVPDDTI